MSENGIRADTVVESLASTEASLYSAREAIRHEIQRGDTSNEDRKRYREYLERIVV